jgi:hypothetical protein
LSTALLTHLNGWLKAATPDKYEAFIALVAPEEKVFFLSQRSQLQILN